MTPVASYRVQLTPEFGFDDVVEHLPPLVALGVSHVYLSPVAEAVPGSPHGYDVVDHTRVRAELGGAAGLERLFAAAAAAGLAVVVDHVPNHASVAVPALQRHWWTMLRDGPGSPSAAWFDVDRSGGDDAVILPILGAPLDEVLVAGQLHVDDGELVLPGGTRLPLAAGTWEAAVGDRVGLAEVLERQHYRLQSWRDPRRNVRRFFTIDDLVAVRVDDPDVAAEVDTLLRTWAAMPGFGGVRIDHVDGLADPGGYLDGVRSALGPASWVVVEKITAPGETLPPSWPVDGTTGYEFMRVVDQLLVDASARWPLEELWQEIKRDGRSFEETEDGARREVLDGDLRPDLERVVRAARRAVGPSDLVDDHTLTAVLVELTSRLPRYRTYLPDDPDGLEVLGSTVTALLTDRPDLSGAVRRVVGAMVEPGGPTDAELRDRWQQLSGPAMAKGAEDRAFFRYHRLASLCEVGGDPGSFGMRVDELHDHNAWVAAHRPRTMLAGSTHDTKRSEDVRARGAALSWRASDWAERVRGWMPALVDTGVYPPAILLALQTVVTCPGLDERRLTAFMVKAAREADLWTSWTESDEHYESRLEDLAHRLLADGRPGDEIAAWAGGLDRSGLELSLVSTALRVTSPGVPDVYQGTEVPTFLLVDPDNRREPDRRALGTAIDAAGQLDLPAALDREPRLAKGVVLRRLLAARRRRPAAFGPEGGYERVDVDGAGADRVAAFVRGGVVATVARCRPGDAAGHQGSGSPNVVLPSGRWRHVLADGLDDVAGTVALDDLLGAAPVAVLELVNPA